MNLNLHHPLRRRLMSADLDAGGTGTGADRGDDFTPTDPEAEAGKGGAGEAAAAAALEAELAAKADGAEGGASADDDPEADKTKPKDTRIPLSRHKEILEKEREQRQALERQLAQFQQGKAVANINEDITVAEDEVLKLEKEYATLLTDGEIDKATAVMAQIRRVERDMGEAKADMKIQAAEARATENARYNVAIERVEASFPQLNPDHDDYDEAVMVEVADLMAAYKSRGMTPTAALQKAVKLIVGAETAKQEAATTVAPRVTSKDVAAERKAEATKKAVAAVESQPPSTAKVGIDSDKAGGGMTAKDVMKMSQEDFGKLPDEILARMRGDVI